MNNKWFRFILFLISNFLALGIGSYLMNNGPRSDWYSLLNKAPWTPPGFVFGVAWSLIMICFAFYMTKLSFKYPFLDKKPICLYSLQWILNVGWNFIFFNQKYFFIGLIILILLWLLLFYLTITSFKRLKNHNLYIIPYLLWMAIAISLNAYIVLMN